MYLMMLASDKHFEGQLQGVRPQKEKIKRIREKVELWT